MRIRVEQLNSVIGDLKGNKKLILEALKKAEKDEIGLLILTESVTTGYPAQDLLEGKHFRESVYSLNEEIVSATGKTWLLFGTITPNKSGVGRKMFNSAILAAEGKQVGVVNKSLLPTYDVFDDLRYFEPDENFHCLDFKGVKLGVTVCEDIWYNENEYNYHTYRLNPAKILKDQGAQLIINVSASPFTKTKHEGRLKMLRHHAEHLKLPIFYANQVGAHTDIIFDGDSMILDSQGNQIVQSEPFIPSYADCTFDAKSGALTNPSKGSSYPEKNEERIFRALCLGLKDYIEKTGFTKDVILGLSGGIDSAIVAVLAVEALGKDHVQAITMPGEFSSEGSVKDSEVLAGNLGFKLHEISIENVNTTFGITLEDVFKGTEFGVAEENIQSRIRGTLLMAVSNKFNSLVLATGNKSEFAVGYSTLYGDMNGALAVIADLYKEEVYALARWLNSEYFGKEIIPVATLEKEPSAELRPGQKDSDSLPPYPILDQIVFRYVEQHQSAAEIEKAGFDSDVVRKVIQMIDRNEFKRFQAPPILKLSAKSFGIGRRRPIVQQWTGQSFIKH
jgi:NAD+ synthetase